MLSALKSHVAYAVIFLATLALIGLTSGSASAIDDEFRYFERMGMDPYTMDIPLGWFMTVSSTDTGHWQRWNNSTNIDDSFNLDGNWRGWCIDALKYDGSVGSARAVSGVPKVKSGDYVEGQFFVYSMSGEVSSGKVAWLHACWDGTYGFRIGVVHQGNGTAKLRFQVKGSTSTDYTSTQAHNFNDAWHRIYYKVKLDSTTSNPTGSVTINVYDANGTLDETDDSSTSAGISRTTVTTLRTATFCDAVWYGVAGEHNELDEWLVDDAWFKEGNDHHGLSTPSALDPGTNGTDVWSFANSLDPYASGTDPQIPTPTSGWSASELTSVETGACDYGMRAGRNSGSSAGSAVMEQKFVMTETANIDDSRTQFTLDGQFHFRLQSDNTASGTFFVLNELLSTDGTGFKFGVESYGGGYYYLRIQTTKLQSGSVVVDQDIRSGTTIYLGDGSWHDYVYDLTMPYSVMGRWDLDVRCDGSSYITTYSTTTFPTLRISRWGVKCDDTSSSTFAWDLDDAAMSGGWSWIE